MYNNTLISSLSNASFQTQHKTTSKAKCSIAHTERAKQTLKWQWMNQCRTLAASPVYHQFAMPSEISGHRRWGLIGPQCSCSLVLQKSIPQLLLLILQYLWFYDLYFKVLELCIKIFFFMILQFVFTIRVYFVFFIPCQKYIFNNLNLYYQINFFVSRE
jgi:hypothetical protein